MKIRHLIFLFLTGIYSLLHLPSASAQQMDSGLDFNFLLGVNLGATTPVPIPGDLKIRSYNPKFNPLMGANLTYYFNEHFGIGTGLMLDWKGMKVGTRVTDVHLSVDVPDVGTLTGYVTGKNTTKVSTLYLVQPVYASWRFNPRWQLKGGIYLAEALSRSFKGNVRDVNILVESPITQEREVSYATLNYGDHTRRFDLGLLAGTEFRMNDHIGFYADFTWGVIPYFSSEVPIRFTMRNIYFSVGMTYRI